MILNEFYNYLKYLKMFHQSTSQFSYSSPGVGPCQHIYFLSSTPLCITHRRNRI